MSENNVSISVTQIKTNANFNVTLLVSIEIKTEKDVEEFPIYSVPKTTNPQLIRIIFDEYKVPKTTGVGF